MSNVVEAARGPGRPKAGGAKPHLEIKLDQHFTSRVYTSGSTVAGHVAVNFQRDTSFESFEIAFTGVAASRMDFVQSFTTNSVRTFMKLHMPIPESDLPESRVFEAGRTYKIPFHFVVPHHLTMGACNHGCAAPAVQDQHLHLPPTLGYWDGDDQAPDMTHIEYAVRAVMARASRAGEPKPPLVDSKKILKVLPATSEEPPLDINFMDKRYCLSKTKSMRKNIVGPKAGEMTVSSSQPEAIMVHADGFGADGTTARISLEFAPSTADAAPPKINSVTGKLVSTTFFGSAPSDTLPNLGPKTSYSHNQVLTYSATTNLFNTRPNKVSWSEHHISTARRDSGYSTAGSPDEFASEDDAENQLRGRRGSRGKNKKTQGPPIRHRAALELPVKLPVSNKKTFVPTFHSCIISRTYVLQLSVSVGPSNTAMTLNVPIQLGVERRFEPQGEELPSFESAMAQASEDDGDAYLRPFSLPMPSNAMQYSMLPRYGEFSRRSVAVA
ncbi:hypothetical protein ACO1O0_004468 [Amphichorda felina]